MTVEEKAKRYDEAIEKLRTMMPNWENLSYNGKTFLQDLVHIIPELKESEDEKWIPKEIAKYLKEKGGYRSCWIAYLEKQGEQKPADKVEQKFNKGDILYEQKTMSILLVYERNGSWLMTFCDYWMLKEKFHVEFPYENYGFVREMSLVPATKEQRDLLFQKMKEAGYEWDAEKKELKKIEQKPIMEIKTAEETLGVDSDTYNKIVDECIYGEQKPACAWSEEDKTVLNNLIYALANDRICNNRDEYVEWLKSLKDRCIPQQTPAWSEEDIEMAKLCIEAIYSTSYLKYSYDDKEDMKIWLNSLKDRVQPQPKQEWSEEDCNQIESIACHLDNIGNGAMAELLLNIMYKYKSHRPQSYWKPSDEQMDALRYVTNFNYGGHKATLVSLYEQLKNLKG